MSGKADYTKKTRRRQRRMEKSSDITRDRMIGRACRRHYGAGGAKWGEPNATWDNPNATWND